MNRKYSVYKKKHKKLITGISTTAVIMSIFIGNMLISAKDLTTDSGELAIQTMQMNIVEQPDYISVSENNFIDDYLPSTYSSIYSNVSPSSIIDSSDEVVKMNYTKLKSKKVPIKWKTGYTITESNIRTKPSTKKKSKIVATLGFNTIIKYAKYNEDWYYIKYKRDKLFISKSLVSKKKIKGSKIIYICSTGFKSFMPYTAITSVNSPQYKLQHSYAYTGNYGIRQVNGRYCVALGSTATSKIGTYFDLILNNGTIIPCILADQKANQDTKSNNLTTSSNGCVSEFVIDYRYLNSAAKISGDMSSCNSDWGSPVVAIKIYKQGIFEF